MITIARFQYTSEAIIIQGRIETEGIRTFLADSLTIDTDPLVSNAIGGVKLQVWEEDIEKAKAILDEISRYSVDNNGNAIQCPKCKNNKVEMVSSISDIKSFFAFMVGLFSLSLPLYIKQKYKCSECSFEFAKS
ncbi:MAG TPA: DUF2007 domain-containing protein [Flavobacterium sp.]|nr:DUF2007 domain-containing protein [Flavobacterium sp.]